MPKMKPFALVDLLNMANKGYPDEFLSEYYDTNTGERRQGDGDTLARFIGTELRDTFDAHASRAEQIEEAHRVLNNAIRDLENVVRALK